MSKKGVVSSVKIRERVSGSTFWRHSWHSSAYSNKDSFPVPLAITVGSCESMTRFKPRK